MWIAVVVIALVDACWTDAFWADTENNSDKQNKIFRHEVDRDEARKWFTEAPGDFFLVCDMAGLNSDYVRNLALRLMRDNVNLRLSSIRTLLKAKASKADVIPTSAS